MSDTPIADTFRARRATADRVRAAQKEPKVALVSVGLGRIQRGFERYFSDLYQVLKDDLRMTLYKSADPHPPGEKVPPFFRAASALTSALPLGVIGAEYKTYKNDCLAFAITLLPELLINDYDVVHVIDYPLERALDLLKRVFRFRARLLFTNGMGMPVEFYPRTADVHHVAESFYEEAVTGGIPKSRLSFVPCGIYTDAFQAEASRDELRRKYNIGENQFVILAVSAIKRVHKRIDHIIEEVSKLDGDFLLWLDGKPEEESVVQMAKEKLGSRCRITYVPSGDVKELYRLADVMVHGALAETFGLAVAEALSAGTVVVAHDSPHFEWLIRDRSCLVDMSAPGALAARLREVRSDEDAFAARARARAASIRERFDWNSLRPAYVEMYRRVAGMQ